MSMQGGILPVWKPVGFSSYDLIRAFKQKTGYNGKVGHGGTLDPFASGVVLLLLGDTTKRFAEIQKWPKTYLAGARLGYESSTLDVEGTLTAAPRAAKIARSDVENVLPSFLGNILQEVPAFSAAKHKGKPLYVHARRGVAIKKSKTVRVNDIRLVALKYPLAALEVTCSSGTYIRQLSADIFKALGISSFLFSLERTRIGRVGRADCAIMEDIENGGYEKLLLKTITEG